MIKSVFIVLVPHFSSHDTRNKLCLAYEFNDNRLIKCLLTLEAVEKTIKKCGPLTKYRLFRFLYIRVYS